MVALTIPRPFIDEVLTRVDLVELIADRIHLRKTGNNYVARCPFHTEKTPSFSVSAAKQFYYCFGCGAHGNAISFLMQYERLEFKEAIANLAARCGLEVPTTAQEHQQLPALQPLYDVLTTATQFYQRALRQSPLAIDYLKRRGISGEIAKKFELGYAPENGRLLFEKINPQAKEPWVSAGMLVKKESGALKARFHHRIMFPIRNMHGKLIGFGGRALGDEMPKYLNSPETPIFQKGNEVYGLYQAKQAERQFDSLLIVEGYMDVIALAQHGITNVVATLGTATSAQHLQRLLRLTPTLFFCFDGDLAGRRAAWRALELALPLMRDGTTIKFLFLPDTEDPDSCVRKEGAAAFQQRIASAVHLADFFFQHIAAKIDLTNPAGKARLAKLAQDYFKKLPQGIFKELMQEKLAQLIGVARDVVEKMDLYDQTVVRPQENRTTTEEFSLAHQAIALLLQKPELVLEIKDVSWLQQVQLPKIDLFIKLLELLQAKPHLQLNAILEYWRDEPATTQLLLKLASREFVFDAVGLAAEFTGAILRMKELACDQVISRLLNKAQQQALTQTEKEQLQQLIAAKIQA